VIFAEPAPTHYDVRFRVAGVPVRVNPWFWVVTIGLSLRGEPSLLQIAIWVGAVMVSILVHELGHAFALRKYGWKPRVTLYGLGGLASADATYLAEEPEGKRQIFISAAGPGAGFLLGGLVIAGLFASGYSSYFFSWKIGLGPIVPSEALYLLTADLLSINLLWGLVNLAPVHPLDGGQIALELFRMRDRNRAVERSLFWSVIVGIVMAFVGGLALESTFMAIMFALLAFNNYLRLKQEHLLHGDSSWELGREVRESLTRFRRDRERRERRRRLEQIDRKAKLTLLTYEAQEEDPVSDHVKREAAVLLESLEKEIKSARPKAARADSVDGTGD
jgi:stage IV sporulation protein FB